MHPHILFPRWKWKVLVVDEAHRLKNQNSIFHTTLTKVQSRPFVSLSSPLFALLCPWQGDWIFFCISSIVFHRVPSPADRNAHSEQPAGDLLPADLHSAQHLHRWGEQCLRQVLLKCTTSACSWYDAYLSCHNVWITFSRISLKHIIWYLLVLYLCIDYSELNQHCLCFQLLSCRVSWSLSCFVESSQRSLWIYRTRRSCWCTMACRRCRRNATEPFWWRTWVRVCEL